MQSYLDLIERVIREGVRRPNRTGVDTLFIPGAMLQFDLRAGFPAVTTKKLAFKSVVAELVGFIRGVTSAADFRALGTKIWDQNANENAAWLANPARRGEDDLGRIYGAQWRRWNTSSGGTVDQLVNAIRTILVDPNSRRIVISAWRPDESDQMALPPCHVLYQFLVDATNRVLHLCMYQRAVDLYLGASFNVCSASALLALIARMTGYTPGVFTHCLADVHLYVNHLEQARTQLMREPYPLPDLKISERIKPLAGADPQEIALALEAVEPSDFALENYRHHPALPAPMAV